MRKLRFYQVSTSDILLHTLLVAIATVSLAVAVVKPVLIVLFACAAIADIVLIMTAYKEHSEPPESENDEQDPW